MGLKVLVRRHRSLGDLDRELKLLVAGGIRLVHLRGLSVQALRLAEPLVGPLEDVPEILEHESDLGFGDAPGAARGLDDVVAALARDRAFVLLALFRDQDVVAGEEKDEEKDEGRGACIS